MDKAQKKLMNEPFEIHGIWYLPNQNIDKDGVQGILKYSPNRIVLELIGTFQGEQNELYFLMGQSQEEKRILGFSNYGEKVTLCNCFPCNAQMNSSGFDTISYVVNCFFAGTRYMANESDEIVEAFTCSFTYLNAWLDLNIININTERETGKIDISCDFNDALLQKKTIKVEDISIVEEISRNVIFPRVYYAEETTKIVVNRFFRVSPTNGHLLSYDKCSDILQKLRRLLTVLIGSPLHILYIDLDYPNEKITYFDGEETERKHCCRVFFTQTGDINKVQKISPYKPGSILIFRRDIRDYIEDIFKNWFSLQEKISEIANPYIMEQYLPTYQEARLLNVVRCLETYHRTFFDSLVGAEEIKDIDFENNRAEILSFINERMPTENRQAFLDRINYEDDRSLQKRLKDILRQTPHTLINKIFGNLNSNDFNKMVRTIVHTRNYYTHRDNKQKYPMAIGNHEELNLYIKKLNVVLQFWLLKCIGVEQETVEKRIVEYNGNYSAFH